VVESVWLLGERYYPTTNTTTTTPDLILLKNYSLLILVLPRPMLVLLVGILLVNIE
jgi:hypothetical protein